MVTASIQRLLILATAYRRPMLFGFVGLLSTVIDLCAYWGMTRLLGFEALVANALAYMIGSTHGYLVNGKLTFRDADPTLGSLKTIVAFVISSTTSLIAATVTMAILLHLVPDLVAKLITVAVTFAINYGLSRTFIYRRRARPSGSASSSDIP